MPKTVQRNLAFPLAGVGRRRGYREHKRPYTTPWAANVRGQGSIERRERGGSRPGTVKHHAADHGAAITALEAVVSVSSGNVRSYDLIMICDGSLIRIRGGVASTSIGGPIHDDNGVIIHTEAGDEIVFDSSVAAANTLTTNNKYATATHSGKVYIADSTLRAYDPQTEILENVLTANEGVVPTSQPVICVYRDRLFLSGKDHVWYASRQGDFSDWHFGGNIDDAGAAVAGTLGDSGMIGFTPNAMVPYQDRFLVFGTTNGLWLLSGDPVGGQISQISDEIGIIGPDAWALLPDGMLVFLSNDGIYVWTIGSAGHPVRFSEERVPAAFDKSYQHDLRNIDPDKNVVTMAYDAEGHGVHLFIKPPSGGKDQWFLDIDNRAMWPVRFLASGHQPVAVTRFESDGVAEGDSQVIREKDVVFGCQDGYLRKFSEAATDDDGEEILSLVMFGPFRLSASDSTDAILTEIHGIMASGSAAVGLECWIAMGESAEVVTDKAVIAMIGRQDDGGLAPPTLGLRGMSFYATWGENRNSAGRPRARGAWAAVWLYSNLRWSFEAIEVKAQQLGRLR